MAVVPHHPLALAVFREHLLKEAALFGFFSCVSRNGLCSKDLPKNALERATCSIQLKPVD